MAAVMKGKKLFGKKDLMTGEQKEGALDAIQNLGAHFSKDKKTDVEAVEAEYLAKMRAKQLKMKRENKEMTRKLKMKENQAAANDNEDEDDL